MPGRKGYPGNQGGYGEAGAKGVMGVGGLLGRAGYPVSFRNQLSSQPTKFPSQHKT